MSDAVADLGEVIEADEVEERQNRLTRAAARLRRRSVAPTERWFQIAGWILLPLGLALIMLGWYGTAHTTRTWEQTPYLVSGGFLGLGLLFVGGFAYYAYWLVRLVDDGRQRATDALELADRQAATLERIERLLRQQREGVDDTVLVATANGSLAHRPDCPMVAGKENLRRVAADDPSLGRCLVCNPPAAHPNGEAQTKPARKR
jgi:hypothetical protein